MAGSPNKVASCKAVKLLLSFVAWISKPPGFSISRTGSTRSPRMASRSGNFPSSTQSGSVVGCFRRSDTTS
ncbi:uncharacterized protein BDW70DRAFT_144443 [Aspergillus foveolatus]|uniref:uncharacterized protein n=1 Tax=Aspergillus foveolatus TaxID=210207 RepID=UPI003CCE4D7C